MYASHHGKLFIFILGICSSLPHTLPGKGSEQPPFNYVVSSACAHPCPDAASDIRKITGFLEISLKKKIDMAHFAVGDVVRKDSTASDVLKDGSISDEAGEEIVGVN